MDNYDEMLKDSYSVIYENRNYGISYNALWNYLDERYTLSREQINGEEIDFNHQVAIIYNRFTGKLYKINQPNEFEFTSNLDTVNYMVLVPFLPIEIYKGDEDIYIISLKLFKKVWATGISYIEYLHHIKNEIGIQTISDDSLFRIYIEIVGEHHSFKSIQNYSNILNFATTESIFRLLEFEELQGSLEQAKEAKEQAQISTELAVKSIRIARNSLWITIFLTFASIIISIIFGVNQWKYDDTKSNQKNKKISSNEYEKQVVPIIKAK